MRKLIGFIGFLFSAIWLILFFLLTIDPIVEIFNAIFSGGDYVGLATAFLVGASASLFMPLSTLLLSVIAMGKYHT